MNRVGILLFLITVSLAKATIMVGQPKVVKPLEIGDQVPDIELNNIVNYSSSKAKLSDFKGKLLILDFWATWCSPCISSIPKLDSLEKEFPDNLLIMGVTYEPSNIALPLLNKVKDKKQVALKSITGDKELSKLFAHTSLPHYVWLDENQKVIAFTEGSELTGNNVRSLLNGSVANIVMKKDERKDIVFDDTKGETMIQPVVRRKQDDGTIIQTNLLESDVIAHSTFTRFISGVPSAAKINPTTLRATNKTIKGLYQIALWHWRDGMFSDSKTIIDIKDSTLYNRITKPQHISAGMQYISWLKDNNGYCYEIKSPESMKDSRFDIMTLELNRFFGAELGIEGVMERREQKYLALIRISQEDKMATKGGKKGHVVNKFGLKVQNYPLSSVILLLRQPLQLSPFLVDETNYSGNVDLNIDCQLSDIAALNKELGKYGLKLAEKQKLDEVAVIRVKK